MRSSPASRCTGRRATSTSFNRLAWRSATDIRTRRTEAPWRVRPPRGLGGHARVDERRSRSASAACGSRDVIGAGTIVDDRRESFAQRRPGVSPGNVGAPGGLRRSDSYYARVHVPESAERGARRGQLDERRAPGRDARVDGPVPARQVTCARRGASSATRSSAREGGRACTSRPFGSRARSTTPPTRGACGRSSGRHRRGDGAVEYERTWELVKRLKAAVRLARWTTSALSTTTCRGPSSATRSARRHARRRGAARLLHQRVPRRLLPALRGRDGAAAADGRHPRARRDRLLARRLLARKKAWIVRDTDAHAWVEVVVRPVRLGHDRPHPAATPARSRSPRRSPPRRASAPAPPPTAAKSDAPAPNTGRTPGRPPGPAGRHRRHRRRPPTRAASRCWVSP